MYRSIVVGTDGSSSAREAVMRAAALARAVTVGAADGGGAGGSAELHVVSAYRPLTAQQLDHLRRALPDRFHGDVRDDMSARAALDDARTLLEGHGLTVTLHDPRGGAAEAILVVAGEVGADLIVVGARGLSGGGRHRSGAVASAVVEGAAADVLVVHGPEPEGEEAETVTSAFGRLGEAASRFETDHPDLVKTISDVSYFLSGLGI